MRAVFHLLTILVKVVDPEAIRIWRTRLWNRDRLSSSTRRKHWAVRSLVTWQDRCGQYIEEGGREEGRGGREGGERGREGWKLTSFCRFHTPSL